MSLYTISPNGDLRLHLHAGQARAHTSRRRFIAVLAGTQSGKTSYGPFWLDKEIAGCGAGDYIAATSSYDLFKLKMLPEMQEVFENVLRTGRYWSGDKVMELRNPITGEYTKRKGDKPWGRIILRSAAARGGLESATAKAAWLDEAGQDEFDVTAWEAILRRLSINGGRALLTTTVYNLGWLKSEVYDRWVDGDTDFDVIQFASTMNPLFPNAEYERAKATMPKWRFEMFYDGKFTKPAGMIYADFEDWMVVNPFSIPDHWTQVKGVDFGGANTATVDLAQDPDTDIWYQYHESLTGDLSTPEHVLEAFKVCPPQRTTAYGGAPGETQYRADWRAAGFPVRQPLVGEVEVGIDRVTELIKTGRYRLFRTCTGTRDEIGKYRRQLDEAGNPTEKIEDKHSFHRCFVAGTTVETGDGHKRIEDVVVGDWVRTRHGLKPVIACGITDYQAQVKTVRFSDGRELTGTGNHPIWTHNRGWVSLDALRYSDIIEVSQSQEVKQWNARHSHSMGLHTIGIPMRGGRQTESISRGRANSCIGRFGSTTTERFQKGITSITLTGTRLTTTSRIWNRFFPRRITRITTRGVLRQPSRRISIRFAPSLKFGTLPGKGASGIANMQKRHGRNENQKSACVCSVANRFSLSHCENQTDFARITVNQHGGVQVALTTKCESAPSVAKSLSAISMRRRSIVPVRVSGVCDAGQAAVYNLTVADAPEYYANGVLVHNCDALRYAVTGIVKRRAQAVAVSRQG